MDIVVIGGGAAGLVSAITAARHGGNVIVLEKEKNCGKKLLVTGNGRCNYYNDDQNISHYHTNGEDLYIKNIINDKSNKMVLDFFDSIGVVPRVRDGYYYPFSNQAVSIVNALLLECEILGVKIINNIWASDIVASGDKFIVHTDKRGYCCDRVIMATGSYAYYKNAVNNGYDIIAKLGHKIIKPLPALVQLRIDDSKLCKRWLGIRSNANISLVVDDRVIRSCVGEILLTIYGISGICAMQLGGDAARYLDNGKRVFVRINFVADLVSCASELEEFLDSYAKKLRGRKVTDLLDNIMNYKLSNFLIKYVGIGKDKKYDELDLDEKRELINAIVNFEIEINGTNTFHEAQVCSGGVSLEDINPLTMESLKVPGIYIAGEVVDVDGDCGGYNLTFAWTTGLIAGINCMGEIAND